MTQATFHTWADLPEVALTPQIKRRLVAGEKVMLLNLTIAKDAVVGEHRHPHEQVTCVLSGRLEFEINGEKRVAHSGEVVVLPSNVPHAVVALEDTHVLDIFSPPREDFLTDETPAYMRK
ncbi:MAG: cupin domain-containing protein [Chloroflexi bacterium]|nr:cupin domain-containing protein [Chloroflexota bacterium]